MKLFPREQIVGIFRGFSEGGLEFHADLVLPYRSDFQSSPMHGQFLLVQLEHEDEAVLGRITSISAQGRLASGAGEDFGIRAVNEDRPIPEELREQYLKYQVSIRVLGVLRTDPFFQRSCVCPVSQETSSRRQQGRIPLRRGAEGGCRP